MWISCSEPHATYTLQVNYTFKLDFQFSKKKPNELIGIGTNALKRRQEGKRYEISGDKEQMDSGVLVVLKKHETEPQSQQLWNHETQTWITKI